MLLTAAALALGVWLLGVVGAYDLGALVHVFLLGGLMLLLVGVLKSRDEAAAAFKSPQPPEKR
jgi:hypothetical protein